MHGLDALNKRHPPHAVNLRALEMYVTLLDIAPEQEYAAHLIVHEQSAAEIFAAANTPHAARHKLPGRGLDAQLLAQFTQCRRYKSLTRRYMPRTRNIVPLGV